MVKMTIYLPPDLKAVVTRSAKERGTSEAEVIRDSIRTALVSEHPRPRGALFASGVQIARKTDEYLRASATADRR